MPGPESLGFVDIQVNGYLGISFSSDDLTVERCAECCRAILSKGGCAAIVTLLPGRRSDPARAPRPQITKDELAKALTSLEMDASEEAVMQMMQRIDKDSSGTITLDEFSSIVAWQLQLLASGLGSRKSLVAES